MVDNNHEVRRKKYEGRIAHSPSPIAILRSCYFWFSLFLVSGLMFPFAVVIFILTVLLDKNRIILHKFTCLWSDIILFINPHWKVTLMGREHIKPGKTYVMVSNHSSGADIILLFKLHRHFKWVAKKGLFYVPFIGWNMFLTGYIPIERSRGRSRLAMMDKAALAIKAGNSVMIFPEGTRTRDGNLQPFKSGAFRLAKKTGSDILPIAITGTFQAIKKGGFIINKNKNLKVIISEPIPYHDFANQDFMAIAKTAHNLIREMQEKA